MTGELFQYEFMRNALAACVLGGTLFSLLGVALVLLRATFLGVCVAHAAFAGAVAGMMLGWPAMLTATGAAVTAALVVGTLGAGRRVGPDTAIGIVFAAMMGLAILLLALLPGSKAEALSAIWGNILLVSRTHVWLMVGLVVLTVGLAVVFGRSVSIVLFDPKLARCLGIPAAAVVTVILVLVAVVTAVHLEIIGGLLVFALVVCPAGAAYQVTYRLPSLVVVACAAGVVSCVGGLAISVGLGRYGIPCPTGPAIVLLSALLFALALALSPKRETR